MRAAPPGGLGMHACMRAGDVPAKSWPHRSGPSWMLGLQACMRFGHQLTTTRTGPAGPPLRAITDTLSVLDWVVRSTIRRTQIVEGRPFKSTSGAKLPLESNAIGRARAEWTNPTNHAPEWFQQGERGSVLMHARPNYKEAHNLADTSADPSREMHTICKNALGRSDRREQGQKALHTRFFAMRRCSNRPSRRESAEQTALRGEPSEGPSRL